MTITRQYLGQFQSESGRFTVSDPCYSTNVWCRGELNNVKKGTWNAEVGIYDAGIWGDRVALLIATHEEWDDDNDDNNDNNGSYIEVISDFVVGVDSGQAGIFDALHYNDESVYSSDEMPKNNYGDSSNGEKWYNFCCDATESEHGANVIPFGVVSSSGFGDGAYHCSVWLDENDEVIKVVIIFIDGEDEEYDGEDEEHDEEDEVDGDEENYDDEDE